MNKYMLLAIAILIALLSLSPNYSMGQGSKLKICEWLQSWYLAGPFQLEEEVYNNKHLLGFETDFLQKTGGETHPVVKEGKVIRYKEMSVRWEKYESPESLINLDKFYSEKSFVAAYAYTEIESDTNGIYIISLGTDDGGKLWFNGKLVWGHHGQRDLVDDDDFVPVNIRKGKNTVLLKSEEWVNGWEFKVRFLPFNLAEFINKQPLFSIHSKSDGIPEITFSQKKPVLDILFKSIYAKAVENKSKDIVWQGQLDAGKNIVLPVKNGEYNKNTLIISATLTDGSLWKKEIPFSSGIPTNYTLFEKGETDFSIILAKDASESEQWAAKELQHWLSEISSASFPIKTDEGEVTENEIIIGYNKHSLALLEPGTKTPEGTDETYLYKNIKSNILLLGGKERGTMYSVFSFLENELGCRWYTPTVDVIPPRSSYKFNYLNHTESPSIRVRNDFYFEAFDPIWAARNKMNGAMNNREQHGGVEAYWSVHTFYRLIPPSEFFDTHPEYYSLIEGKRSHERAQLCLTNPDVLDIITERLKNVIRENPDYLIYSVSQNDWHGECQCDKCQAIVKKEKSEAGLMIWFVNQVADRIKDEFPDKFVGTLAYQYTRKPPATVKPRENVVVRLCSYECCFAHDFKSCPNNLAFFNDLKGWAEVAPHIYIWDYVVSFHEYILPFPNFKVLQENIKTLRDNNAIGIMEQGAYQSRGGEFAELRAYFIAKLLWNPEIDADLVIDDFMSGYYGRSGQYIRIYFDLLHDLITPDTHFDLKLKHFNNLFTNEFINKAEQIFDNAEQVADNDKILQRVEMARLPLMYLKCSKSPVQAKIDGVYNRFCEIVERERITHFNEAGKPFVERFHRKMESAK